MPCLLKNIHFNHPVSYKTGQDLYSHVANPLQISIHPPRAGWDCYMGGHAADGGNFNPPTPCGVGQPQVEMNLQVLTFQSTHPVRGGTNDFAADVFIKLISIHPPRAGWDGSTLRTKWAMLYFNPPTPCGVGQDCVEIAAQVIHISIHPPRAGWDALAASALKAGGGISIHPPRAGWDVERYIC